MADDVSAGRLHLDAVADTAGFARETQAKINTELRNVRARIKAELDDRGVVRQARETAKKAQQAATAKIKAELDTRTLVASARAAAVAASQAAKVKIKAEIDQARFQASLAASVAALNNKYTISVNVEADTAAAKAKIDAFRAEQRANPISTGLNINMGGAAGTALMQLSKIPLIAGGIYVLVGALTQVVGGLFAITSAASQSVVALAAIPNLLGAIAQGGAVLLAGFSGIGDAVKELGEADTASAAQTASAAGVRDDSARRVAAAQEALANAYHQAEDAARQAGYAVADAEWNLQEAHEAAAEAQTNLNEARQQARENLDELQESLRRAALTEAQASNSLQKARQNLQDVMWDESATEQERADALLAVEEAKVAVDESRDAHKDLAKEKAKADEEGVKGSEQVLAAVEALSDANHALMLAQRQQFEAGHAQADTARQNAQMIAAAQQAVADAQRSGLAATQAQSAALTDQMAAYNKLTPAAQRFARFLFERVMPRFGKLRDAVQESLLPPLQKGIRLAMPLIDTLQTGLVGTADVVGRLAIQAGRLFGSKGFNADTATIMDSNNKVLRLFGKAALNIIEILSDLAVVAGPTLAQPFARWVLNVTKGWKASVQAARETGALADRFETARERAGQLARIIGNVAGALYGMGKAATPAGVDLLNTLERVTERWDKWANSDAGQKRMREFFEATKPVTKQFFTLVGQIAKMLVLLSESGGGPIMGALSALTGVVRGLNAVLATPYLGTAVGWLLTLAGAAGGLGIVAGVMLKMGSSIAMLARITGIAKAWALFKNSVMLVRIQLGLLAVQQKLVNAAMLVGRGIMAAMRVAASLMFGPWGIAIALVVAGFILLYKKVGWFRDAVKAVAKGITTFFGWIVDAAKWLWDVLFGHSIFPDIVDGLEWFAKVLGKIFDGVKTAIEWLGDAFSWLWDHAVKPAWTFIQKAVSVAWNYYYKPILKLLGKALQVAGDVALWLWKHAIVPAWEGIQKAISVVWPVVKKYFALIAKGMQAVGAIAKWLWRKIITPAWKGIQKAISIAWNYYYKPIFKALRKGFDVIGDIAKWLWRKVIVPAWKGIQAAIKVAWNGGIKPVFGFLAKGVRNIAEVFRWLWNKVVTPVWNGIKSTISTVWNKGIKPVFNALRDFVKTTIPDAFRTGRDAIGRIWDGLKSLAAKPVEFIVNTVYNDGIRKVINLIPGVDDLPSVSFNYAKGTSSVLPGYTPGRDVHNFRSADGRIGLNLSGGEGILRPEAVRQMGPKAVDYINAAARKGGNALRQVLGMGVDHSRARGGTLPSFRKTMSYFLGGVLPLPGATSIVQHTSGYSYPWAGDLNRGSGYDDYGAPIVAWKGGLAQPFDYGSDTSYGRGMGINHVGGGSSFYAHMSRVLTGLSGQIVKAGQTIGYVGDYGNTGSPPTSHLHFEVRSGSISGGDIKGMANPGQSQADKWKDAIGGILGAIKNFPGMIGDLANKGGWGPMLTDAVKSIGGSVRKWINEKIPNEIEVNNFPNIPLPDNPIPSLFDKGGRWKSGTLGMNLSGRAETVFTNENIVDLSANLARIAGTLRSQVVDAKGGGGAPLVGELTLQAPPDKVKDVLGDMQHALRILSLGGVHAHRAAGAPV